MVWQPGSTSLDPRLEVALWNAVSTLETEADVWRTVASISGTDRAWERSRAIESHARVIREALEASANGPHEGGGKG